MRQYGSAAQSDWQTLKSLSERKVRTVLYRVIKKDEQ